MSQAKLGFAQVEHLLNTKRVTKAKSCGYNLRLWVIAIFVTKNKNEKINKEKLI